MSSGLWDVALNVIASILFFAMGMAAERALTWFRMRSLRHLWAPFRGARNLVVAMTTRQGPLARSTPRISLRELEAFVAIARAISPMRLEPRVVDSEVRLRDVADKNIVILGGPSANRLAAEVLRATAKTPFAFDAERQAISVSDRTYTPVENEAGALQRDYALLLRLRSPFRSDRLMLMCLGCHGFGTLGAARVLTDSGLAKQLLGATKGAECFAALLSFDLSDGNIVRTHFEETYVLPSEQPQPTGRIEPAI